MHHMRRPQINTTRQRALTHLTRPWQACFRSECLLPHDANARPTLAHRCALRPCAWRVLVTAWSVAAPVTCWDPALALVLSRSHPTPSLPARASDGPPLPTATAAALLQQ